MSRPARPPLNGDLNQWWPGKKWWHKPGPWCRTKARMGRRGAMMILLGTTYMLIGYGEATRPQADIPGAWHLDMSSGARCVFWMLTGMIAIAFALVRPHSPMDRYPAPKWWQTDTPGWVSLYLAPCLVIASFLTSWFLWTVTDHSASPPIGDGTAWYNATLRVPFVLIVLICSGWLENPRKGC